MTMCDMVLKWMEFEQQASKEDYPLMLEQDTRKLTS